MNNLTPCIIHTRTTNKKKYNLPQRKAEIDDPHYDSSYSHPSLASPIHLIALPQVNRSTLTDPSWTNNRINRHHYRK